ncbi:unnamed protein product [Gongylonema pulchrum]|uniref:Ovule protein n=1 Tax=Gongylonema pulchrum TaxID=637853 RepID=A0A183E4Q9_9BILA|nr:unnamed protein product [Gongylonema pulchrum]
MAASSSRLISYYCCSSTYQVINFFTDDNGHPYKLRKWRIPGSNMCDPSSISSGITRFTPTVYIPSSSVATLTPSPSAHLCCPRLLAFLSLFLLSMPNKMYYLCF